MSNTFCSLPWLHTIISFTGHVFNCCNTQKPGNHIGNIKKEKYEDIVNSERMRKLRVQLLNGEKPDICERCFRQEELNIQSMRMGFTEYFNDVMNYDIAVKNTSSDGYYPDFFPYYLEVQLSNKCNFRCRSCFPLSSTGWNHDADLLNKPSGNFYRSYPFYRLQNIHELVPDLDKVRFLRFMGGEPLIHPEHYKLLEYMIEHDYAKNIELSYNSNFSHLTYHKWDVLKLWKNFKYVFYKASLDDSYERGEYIRKGQDWKKIVYNRKRMLKISPEVAFQFYSVISVFSIWHVPEFVKEWLDLDMIDDHGFHHIILEEPEWLKIQILPNEFKDKIKKKYRKFKFPPYIQKQMYQIIGHLYLEDLYEELFPKFKEMTTMIDKVRDESYLDIFEELRGL